MVRGKVSRFNRLMAGVLAGLLMAASGAQTAKADTTHEDFIEAAIASECSAMEHMDYVENQVVVSFHSSTGKVRLAREGKVLLQDVTIEDVAEFDDLYVATISSKTKSTEELLKWAYSKGYVELAAANATVDLASIDGYVEPNASELAIDTYKTAVLSDVTATGEIELALDPMRGGQWHMVGATNVALTGTSTGIGLARPETTPLATPVVAIIDTGIDYTHEDLVDSLWVNPLPDEIAGTYGYDVANNDDDPKDTYGHGTHVAGIIAATIGNNKGIEGIADAKIMTVKVCKDNSEVIEIGKVAMCFSYIYRCMGKGINVTAVNCSWGGSLFEYNYEGGISFYGNIVNGIIDSMGEEGVLTVFAAGNESKDMDKRISDFENSSISPWEFGIYETVQDYMDTILPAPYNLLSEYVITVGALDENNKPAKYTNYSSRAVNLMAPGSLILSTWHKNRFMPQVYGDEQKLATTMYYNTFSESEKNILINDSLKVYTTTDLGLNSVQRIKDDVYAPIQGQAEVLTDDNGDSYVKFTTVSTGSAGYETYGCDHVGCDLYIDVTDLHLDKSKKYHISYMYCYTTAGEDLSELEWMPRSEEKITDKFSFVTVGDRTYLSIIVASGPLVAYIDDIAVSYADLPDESFGKYYLSSGTSMAAPMVTGAIAYLRSYMTESSAIEIRDIIINNVAKSDELASYCTSSGILDMSAYPDIIKAYCKKRGIEFLMPGETPEPPIEESGNQMKGLVIEKNKDTIYFSRNKSLKLKALFNSKKLKNNKITWKVNKPKYATIDKSGKITAKKAGIGHTIKITLKTKDGTKTTCKIKIKK